jgi:hypothetical protein
VVGGKSAWQFRLRLSYRGIVEVLLVGPLPNFSDLCVVDLDLVMDLVGGQGGSIHDHEDSRGTRGNKRDGIQGKF